VHSQTPSSQTPRPSQVPHEPPHPSAPQPSLAHFGLHWQTPPIHDPPAEHSPQVPPHPSDPQLSPPHAGTQPATRQPGRSKHWASSLAVSHPHGVPLQPFGRKTQPGFVVHFAPEVEVQTAPISPHTEYSEFHAQPASVHAGSSREAVHFDASSTQRAEAWNSQPGASEHASLLWYVLQEGDLPTQVGSVVGAAQVTASRAVSEPSSHRITQTLGAVQQTR
jgi:hypothetical protein